MIENQLNIVNQNSELKTTNPTPPGSKKAEVKWWVVLVIILFVLLISGLSYLLKYRKQTESLTPPNIEPSVTSVPTSASPNSKQTPEKSVIHNLSFNNQNFIWQETNQENTDISTKSYPCAEDVKEAQQLLHKFIQEHPAYPYSFLANPDGQYTLPEIENSFWIKRDGLYFENFATRQFNYQNTWEVFACDQLQNLKGGSIFKSGRQKIADLTYIPQTNTEILLLIDLLLSSEVIENGFYTRGIIVDKITSRQIIGDYSSPKIEVKDQIFLVKEICDYEGCNPPPPEVKTITYLLDNKNKEFYLIVP